MNETDCLVTHIELSLSLQTHEPVVLEAKFLLFHVAQQTLSTERKTRNERHATGCKSKSILYTLPRIIS